MRVELFNFVKSMLENGAFYRPIPAVRKVGAQFFLLILVASSVKLNNEYDE
jgi:hypothetical protein